MSSGVPSVKRACGCARLLSGVVRFRMMLLVIVWAAGGGWVCEEDKKEL